MPVHIPSELYDHTLDFLHNDRAALSACSVVCKAWLPSSRFHLFSNLHISDRSGPLLCKALNIPGTTIPRRIHSIHFQFLSSAEEDRQKALACIKTLSNHFQRITGRLSIFAYAVSLDEFLCAAYPIEEGKEEGGLRDFGCVSLMNVRLHQQLELNILASKSSSLRNMVLQGVDFQGGSPSRSLVASSVMQPANLGYLRRLELGEMWPQGIVDWLKSHADCYDSIEELDVMLIHERDECVREIISSCGAHLQRLKVTIGAQVNARQPLDLSANTFLESLVIRLSYNAVQYPDLQPLLSSITSHCLNELVIGFPYVAKIADLDLLAWSAIDRTPASTVQLRMMLAGDQDSELCADTARAKLPSYHSRGALHLNIRTLGQKATDRS